MTLPYTAAALVNSTGSIGRVHSCEFSTLDAPNLMTIRYDPTRQMSVAGDI